MKHLIAYSIFESHSQNDQEMNFLQSLREDETIKTWLENVNVQDFEDPYNQDVCTLITPYGDQIKAVFTPDEYQEDGGDGWFYDTCSYIDDLGIYYTIPGSARARGYNDLPDAEWNWNQEGISAHIGSSFDPIKFLQAAIRKAPIVASRVYGLLPENKKKEADELFSRLGVDIKKISKGSNLLTSLEK